MPDNPLQSPRNHILSDLSLVCANFGDGLTLRDVLNDWFAFLGGRPGEVVVLDNGSDIQTRRASLECFEAGMIDKLLLVRPGHPDTPKERAHLAEHTAPSIALKRYLLFFKFDTLPYREGHAEWLSEAISYLDKEEVFAISGTYNFHCKHHEAWPGWYFSDKCSENFALMKRSNFIQAMEEFCGEYISSGFTAKNPAAATGQDRFLVEVAFERYIQKHKKYTLMREEDSSWTIFHTNVHGKELGKVRSDYLARKRVTKFLNAGSTGVKPPGIYYGKPTMAAWLTRMRTRFGGSPAGPYWRMIKTLLRRAINNNNML